MQSPADHMAGERIYDVRDPRRPRLVKNVQTCKGSHTHMLVPSPSDKGVVYLHMQGSCSGCPSSTATLKHGIEGLLKHYVPEVTEVRDGIAAELDQFHENELLHWPRWCEEQMRSENADFVLCVCTAEYKRRVEGRLRGRARRARRPARHRRAAQPRCRADAQAAARVRLKRRRPQTGTAVVFFKRSSTKLVLQSCTLGCMSRVSLMKRA